ETQLKYQLKLEKMTFVASTRLNVIEILQLASIPLSGATASSKSGLPTLAWKNLKAQLAQFDSFKSKQRMTFFHELIRTLKVDPQAVIEFKDWMALQRDQAGGHQERFIFGIGVLGA